MPMTNKFSEKDFRDWLINDKLFSKKASGDVVSRLKRCINIEPLAEYKDPTKYFDSILQYPVLESIPKSSQASMYRAVRMYFEYVAKYSR